MAEPTVGASALSTDPDAAPARRPGRPRRFWPLLRATVIIAGLGVAGYVLVLASGAHGVGGMAAWFAGSIVGHDLVLFPAYALADRVLVAVLGKPSVSRRLRVSPLNHVRVPTLGALVLFCLYFPGIVEQGRHTYGAATGQTQQPFLGRWLLAVGLMYLVSALLFAGRLRRTRRRLDQQTARSPGRSDARVARARG